MYIIDKIMKSKVTKVQFLSTISKMGEDRIIRVPKKYQKLMSVMEGKDIRVVCDDEFLSQAAVEGSTHNRK